MVHKDDVLLKRGIVFGMCNPLLDIMSHVDEGFLNKYNLIDDNAILAENHHLPLYDEIFLRSNTEFAPGGAVQNTFKILQWITQKPFLTTFMGSIGNDKFGEIMKNKMHSHGINTLYQTQDDDGTGTCAVLINKDKRSLCANLGAAKRFSKNHLLENLKAIYQADYFYISGYFLAVCPNSILHVAQHAMNNGKTFMMNISALYLCSVYKEQFMSVYPYIDILFGNESEIRAFAKENGVLEDDLRKLSLHICRGDKINNQKPRIVVCTRDKNPTLLVTENFVKEYPVIPINSNDIVDTNGAGDAFVGGFLSQMIQGKAFDECVEYGHKAAYIIIKRSGCTFPEDVEFDKSFQQIKCS